MKSFQNYLTLAFCVLSFSVSAQLDLDNTMTVEELVNEVLLGDGVDAFNITYNGEPGDQVSVQAGTFNAVESTFPIDSGVVMASSLINIVNTGGGENNINIPEVPDFSDPDLAEIAGFASRNACVIEFDFTVSSDSVKFDYIFSSAEYPGFTCSSFNDVFGFFLSGPGITGPYEGNAKNIALIPLEFEGDDEIPVGVNTVNSGVPSAGDPSNCLEVNPDFVEDSQYFIPNDPPAPDAMQIPGHTVVLTAEEEIECGGTYHIKLAISNANDEFLQSAVFLKAGSFSAFGEVFASFSPVFGDDGGAVTQEGFDSIAVAGCTNPFITLERPQNATFDTLYFALGGDAIESPNGSEGSGDYWIPGGFPEGFGSADEVSFEIETINPNITDTLEIELYIIFSGCGGVIDTTTVIIPIAPPPVIDIFAENQILICPADTPVFYGPDAEGGLLPHIYDWFDLDTYPDEQNRLLDVPEDEEMYTVRVTDQCEFNYDTTSFSVINAFPLPLEMGINPFADPTCPNEPVDLGTTTLNGSPPYSYIWTDDNGNTYASMEDITVSDINPVALTFTPNLEVDLTVIDSCGRSVADSIVINYPVYDSLSVSFGPLTDNCPDGPVELEAETTGGAGDLNYNWGIVEGESTFTSGFSSDTEITYIDAGSGFNTISLLVRDRCNLLGQDMITFDEDGELLNTGLDSYEIRIPYINLDPLPNIITPNGDGRNEVFVVPGIDAFENASVLIYDRWGKLIYENSSYDAGTNEATVSQGFSAEGFSDGSFFYIVNIDSGECTTQGTLEVVGGSE